MTKAPQASVIQLQSEFKALWLNLEHNTEALGASLRGNTGGETPEKTPAEVIVRCHPLFDRIEQEVMAVIHIQQLKQHFG